MKFFLDGEWNGYGGELISLALVNFHGMFWYECLECQQPNEWVSRNVIPILHKKPISLKEMQLSLAKFLQPCSQVEIIADWPEDVAYFCHFLVTGPGKRIDTPPLSFTIRRDLDTDKSAIPHNALEDARALMQAWREAEMKKS